MASNWRSILGALCAFVLVPACQEGVEIDVAQEAGSVTFTPKAVSAAFHPCIRSAYVYADGPEGAPPLWSLIDGRLRGACVRAIRYGTVPAGFSAKPLAPALKSGQRYRIDLLGSGFNASATFVRK